MSRSHDAWRAMLLLGAAWSVLAMPAEAFSKAGESEAAAEFQPPVGRPMLLSRTLWRELVDGRQIVATRRYEIRFSRKGLGWRVDGELVASEVEAPERLRQLAELERTRPDDGLFPIVLDHHGEIARAVAAPAPGKQGGATVQRAVDLVLARLGQQQGAAADPPQVRAFIAQIQTLAAAAVTTRWPSGLFVPATGSSREEQRFALPDGSEGVVTSEVTRAASADRATMAACERRVVTQIAGDRRLTREQWTLEPLAEMASR